MMRHRSTPRADTGIGQLERDRHHVTDVRHIDDPHRPNRVTEPQRHVLPGAQPVRERGPVHGRDDAQHAHTIGPRRARSEDPLIVALDRERVRRGLTMAQLSKLAGLSAATWSNIYNRQAATLYTLRPIAAALGYEIGLIPTPARELRPHGTAAAAARHRYHGEKLCGLCLAWDRRRKRELYAQQRTRRVVA